MRAKRGAVFCFILNIYSIDMGDRALRARSRHGVSEPDPPTSGAAEAQLPASADPDSVSTQHGKRSGVVPEADARARAGTDVPATSEEDAAPASAPSYSMSRESSRATSTRRSGDWRVASPTPGSGWASALLQRCRLQVPHQEWVERARRHRATRRRKR